MRTATPGSVSSSRLERSSSRRACRSGGRPRRVGGSPPMGRAARTSRLPLSFSPTGSFRPVRLVLDWDGTVTERDTLDLVLRVFGDDQIYDRAEAELEAGRMTLNGVIAAEFATVMAPLDEVVAYVVEHARVRPG